MAKGGLSIDLKHHRFCLHLMTGDTLMHNLKSMLSVLVLGAVIIGSPAQAAMTIQLDFVSGTSASAQTSFTNAANFWGSKFTDTVSLRFTVGTASLGPGILASTDSADVTTTYGAVRAAMAADITSANDTAAVARLPNTSSVSLYLNRTANSPNGAGSATPFVDNDGDANNSSINLTTANAKALGLTVSTGAQTATGCLSTCDGYIVFGNSFTYDYDPTNGVTSGAYDFQGLAVHELGHALGFISGVDILDQNSSNNLFYNDNQFTFVSTLDLFRCSSTAAGVGALVDWTANTSAKSFSLNSNCTNTLGTFSTGVVWGDGRQASHWKDNLGLGIMDPTAGTGELLSVSTLDLTAFDVIGWNLAAVPEPITLTLAGTWLAGLAAARRRRRV
jgi:hypothetical protein